MWKWLEKKGIERKDLISTALELYVPHPGVENEEKAKKLLDDIFDEVLKDPNINALILAGFHLEDDGASGSIPGIKKEDFERDSVALVADEILGMAIAEFIGGTRARFEYVRFDTKKPGILGRLGPFVDDVICGLVAGASSKMYSSAILTRNDKNPK
jgi:alpha-ribazole phosphatase CobZ